jgi:hypothetical protein
MGGLFGIGGSAAKTDRKQQLQSWGELQGLFGTANKAGKQELSTGIGDVNKAKDYWGAIMSGDPTAMSKALAPQISAIQGQSGQAVRGLQQFSGRSGGTSGAVEATNAEAASAVQNLFDLLGPMAAQEFQQLAQGEVSTGENLLGIAGSSAAEVGAQASGARQIDVPVQQAQQSAVIQSIGALMGLA